MKKGLTLMELLVVISILTTLAALLFPVYLNVRTKMYAVSCANQLRQIGLAIKMYVHEQRDDTPYSMCRQLGQLYPHYIQSKDLLVCPYFKAIAAEVVEELEEIYQTKQGCSWSSYHEVSPWGWDEIAEKNPGEVLSFREIFAIRGDQTPVVWCEIHRHGCPDFGFPIAAGPKGSAFSQNCDSFANPNAPYVVLRWGGNVHLIYYEGIPGSIAFMLEY